MEKVLNFKSNAHKLNMGDLNKDHAREIIFKKKENNRMLVELSAIDDEFSFDEVKNRVLSSTIIEYELSKKTAKEEIYESVEPLFTIQEKDNHSRIRIMYDNDGIPNVVVEPTYLVSCTYHKA